MTGGSEPPLPSLDALREVADVVILESAANVREIAAGVEVIFNWSGSRSLIREVFITCRNLRWIHSRSAGLERILFPELIASYVTVTNGRGVFSPALGEFALAAILYFAKDLRRMIISQMANSWCPFEVTMVAGQTLGIVGYGDIGHAIAARARALGMQVLALKRKPLPPTAPNQFADQIYGSDERLAMLPRCDYIVVATPLNGETHGMIGEAEFASMKRSAVVINVGRGPVIDEPAMVKALSEHRIRGAALDVFDEEPLPSGHPFYQLENVLLSPHCADHTPGWLDDAMRFFLAQLARFRRGETLLNVVDKALGY